MAWNEGWIDPASLIPDDWLSSSSFQSMAIIVRDYFDRKYPSTPIPNKTSTTEYSAPANIYNHDPDIINVFLNLFNRYIPQTFPIFDGVKVTRLTRPEYCLAVAAVGGLFCSVKGYFEITRAMYNDSRKLLLGFVSMGPPMVFADLIFSRSKTDLVSKIHLPAPRRSSV